MMFSSKSYILKTALIGGLISCPACRKSDDFPARYLNQTPPGRRAERFAPDLLPGERNFRDAAFGSDGREFYFTEIQGDRFTIMVSTCEAGAWTPPSTAPFSGEYNDFEPCITSDGKHFLFGSMRPSQDKPDMTGDVDLWIMDRTETGWSDPRRMPEPITTDCMEYYPSLTDNGTLYFGRNDSTNTRGDIYVSRLKDGTYQEPVVLPETVNRPATSFNAFIARDESYLLYSRYIEGDGGYHADIFVSFRDENGNWSEGVNLGPEVNSPGNDHAPYVTHDGTYLFFASTRTPPQSRSDDHDIYWVDAGIIQRLRP